MSRHNPQTREWQALSNDHHLAPFSDFKQLKEKGPRIITHAKGVYLWDSEGNKILDGMAGLWMELIEGRTLSQWQRGERPPYDVEAT